MPRVSTSSLRALQLYSQAEAMGTDEGPPPDKLGTVAALLAEALREDPDFVSAHMKQSIVMRLQNRMAESLTHAERAVSLAERATDIERLLSRAELLGVRALLASDPVERQRLFEESAQVYEAVRRIQPDHHQALVCLTNIYRIHLGRPNFEVATALATLRPNSVRWRMAAFKAAIASGRIDETNLLAQQPIPEPRDPQAAFWAALLRIHDAWLRNQPSEALATADLMAGQVPSLPGELASAHRRALISVYLTLGAFRRAEALLPLVEPDVARRFDGLLVAVERRDPAGLRRVLARDYPRLEDVAAVSSTLIDAGLLSRARQAVEVLKRRGAGPFSILVEGQLAIAEDRLDEGIALLTQYRGLHLGLPSSVRAALALADALVRRGRLDEAIGMLEQLSKRRLEFIADQRSAGSAWLSVRDALADLYYRNGRLAEAKAVDDELQTLLAVADEDHPIKRRIGDRSTYSRSPHH